MIKKNYKPISTTETILSDALKIENDIKWLLERVYPFHRKKTFSDFRGVKWSWPFNKKKKKKRRKPNEISQNKAKVGNISRNR